MGTEQHLQHFLVDFDNSKDIEEVKDCGSSKIRIWRDLISCTEQWTKLIEINFDENLAQTYFESVDEEHRKQYFTFGIGCIINFVQANFTGPDLPKHIEDFFNSDLFTCVNFSKLLSVNNEDINRNTKFPTLLVAAKTIFKNCQYHEVLNLWWQWRATIVHQQILEDLSPTLLSNADRLLPDLYGSPLDGHIKAQLQVELAQLYLMYRNIARAEHHIEKACNILGLKYELTGKLGKRTKFQQKDIAQLALEVTLIEKENILRPPVHEFIVPKNLTLEDQVRFDALKYAENLSRDMLFPNTEQMLLLTVVQAMIISKPQDDLYYEELQPFLELILSQNNTWTVRAVTLLLRCKLEAKHKRTIERSMKQCEEVLNCVRKDVPHPLNRVGSVYGTGLQPIWKTEAQLAELMFNFGLVKNSLELYLKLEFWEEIIVCYTLLQMRQKAVEFIKLQLELCPTVKLLCLLGDATDNVDCYEKAWELSKKCSSRAQRHWGQFFYSRKEYQQCISHFEKSVSINPLQLTVWNRLGYAALECEKWQQAATAYRRYTNLEPGNFEAWNNLAKAYIKVGNKRSAHQALIDALRCNYENWKVWDNLMVVSADIAHFSDVIRAYHRILDIKAKHLDLEVLGALVYGVCNNINDSEGRPAANLLPKTRELLGRITPLYPGDGHLWELYASLAPVSLLRAQRLLRALRGYTQNGWENNSCKCQQVLYVCHKLAEVALGEDIACTDSLVNSVRLNLLSAISTIKKQDFEETRSLLRDVTGLFTKVLEKGKSAHARAENKD